MGRISVEGIRGYGYHGCMDEEARIGQAYIVDVHMEVDFMKAAREDRLEHTVDYVHVNRVVMEELENRSKLIETVSLRIAERLKADERISQVEVKVCKPAPPINGDVDRVCTTVTL
jgi:dihydroneopterin aldolase